ncbi:condensation domain-containing protein, partial [Streptomyces parvus]|uniref:condensation domain-containing protein n=1 Tax=Streptomyces parvus TaxID=66428 RepID=UPI0021CC549E
MFPVALTPGADRPGEALKAVKEQLRAVPRRGVGYGLTHDLTALPAGLSFNYLGQFDAVTAGGPLGVVAESAGAMTAESGVRAHLVEVNGAVSGGRLSVGWSYSSNLHDRATVAGLAEEFMVRLRALIEHCVAGDAGGLTPSDVPLAGLDQAALDAFADRQAEDVYPLSPLQQGMLFHALAEPDSGLYVEQIHWRVHGELDADRLRHAWQAVMERHSVLRTTIGTDTGAPLQFVHRRFEVPFDLIDWSGLSEGERDSRIAELVTADRLSGFAFDTGPLFRIRLVRLGSSTHHLVWSFHHILLDGWSLSTVLRDVFAWYERPSPGDDHVRPFRDYLGWLGEQDLDAAEEFWRRRLAGFEEVTPFDPGTAPRPDDGPGKGRVGMGEVRLPAETLNGLARLARSQRLTLSTLAQGAWGLLLSRYSGRRDVVFGTTVSGRPAGLDGVEEM